MSSASDKMAERIVEVHADVQKKLEETNAEYKEKADQHRRLKVKSERVLSPACSPDHAKEPPLHVDEIDFRIFQISLTPYVAIAAREIFQSRFAPLGHLLQQPSRFICCNQLNADETGNQGLGHNHRIDAQTVKRVAVLHYYGNMKQCLELGIPKYKGHWKKFLKLEDQFMSECKLNLQYNRFSGNIPSALVTGLWMSALGVVGLALNLRAYGFVSQEIHAATQQFNSIRCWDSEKSGSAGHQL
ncbi:hypothetical protein HHK36_024066 [Tetracentron sinense]|uniref:Uncharacterized protein n=1 Tax=Tetracentron sinense TaxID=13715 RepID=A0A834YML7_TETSI|nr:hypothetical protein HHK36_024066 [Tetracentron sinense]